MKPSIFALIIALMSMGQFAYSQITVACAANMQYAMEEIVALYAKTGGEVKRIYGASGKLVSQIRNGAPFDLFVSADMDYPESLFVWKLAVDKPRVYAFGKLIFWSMKPGLVEKGLAALADSTIKIIAIADPKSAPYGREAIRTLKNVGIHDAVLSRLVLGDNIAQAAQYIVTGAADIGFVAKSIALSPPMTGKGTWREVDSALYNRIAQGVVECRYGEDNHPKASRQFMSFLFGDEAQATLKRFGYTLP